jgi:glutamyl-tRNA reductase
MMHRVASRQPGRQIAGDTDVPLVVAGCDFRVASATWRNRLLLDGDQRLELTKLLGEACDAQGLVVLETCNRVEWIVASKSPRWAGELLRAQMVDRWLESGNEGAHVRQLPVPYVYTGRSAVQHLLRVAVGLESFVLGEREIAGQLNRALTAARQAGHASGYHNALQTAVGRTVRKVQRLTHWRHHTRGVHGLALEATRRHLPQLPHHEKQLVGVLGMGEIGRKASAALSQAGRFKILHINRTVSAERANDWLPYANLAEILPNLDALVVATGAREPTVDLDLLPRRDKPLLVIDLGAPHQVRFTRQLAEGEPAITSIDLDDLLAEPAASPNLSELPTVQELVDEGVREFLLETRKRELAGLLRAAHDAYDRHGYELLPVLVDTELAELSEEHRRRVEQSIRGLLRDMTREFVHHVEAAADSGRKVEGEGMPRNGTDPEPVAALSEG